MRARKHSHERRAMKEEPEKKTRDGQKGEPERRARKEGLKGLPERIVRK